MGCFKFILQRLLGIIKKKFLQKPLEQVQYENLLSRFLIKRYMTIMKFQGIQISKYLIPRILGVKVVGHSFLLFQGFCWSCVEGLLTYYLAYKADLGNIRTVLVGHISLLICDAYGGKEHCLNRHRHQEVSPSQAYQSLLIIVLLGKISYAIYLVYFLCTRCILVFSNKMYHLLKKQNSRL